MVGSDEGCLSVIYTALWFIVEEEFLVGSGSFATSDMTVEIMAKTKAMTSKWRLSAVDVCFISDSMNKPSTIQAGCLHSSE